MPAPARGPAYPSVGSKASGPGPRLAPGAVATSAPNVAPSAAPTPAASSAVSSVGAAPFAAEALTLVERASPDGQWVLLCQVRKDEPRTATPPLRRYLIAPNQELAIDAFLSASPDGRFALFTQNGALMLWRSIASKSEDLSALGADARLSAESYASVRALDFDAKSEHLLYVKRGVDKNARVVLRDLKDGSERELDPGPGEVWRAHFDPGGVFLTLQMISADTNKNGRLDFPAPLLAGPRGCGDDLNHFRSWESKGDRPETVLLPLTGGAPIHEPDLVMPVLDALLLRDENGALLLERGGKKRLLEPAECKGRIVYADAQRELFIVGCAQKKKTGRVSLELVTPEGRKPLALELASVELDREIADAPRLVALYPGSDSVLFDADHRELITLSPGDSVIATRQARALIRRGKELLIYDADLRKELPLPGTVDKFPDVLRALPFVFVSPLLVNLDAGEIAGVSQQRPLALTTGGQLLLPASDADAPSLARGPLHWSAPQKPQ